MKFAGLLVVLCVGITVANASVVLESGGGQQVTDDVSGGTTVSVTNTGNAANYLVVVVTSESSEATSATYGGVDMALIGTYVNTRSTQIFGLTTPASSGDIALSFSGGIYNGQGFGYAFLSGVTGVEATAASGSGGPISYSSEVSTGSLAIFGGGGNGSTVANPTPVDGILFTSAGQSGFGSFGTDIGYDADLTAGSYSTTINSGSDYFAGVVLTPEPTTLGLLGLGGLGVLLRRNKQRSA